jgi:hypothetical protein
VRGAKETALFPVQHRVQRKPLQKVSVGRKEDGDSLVEMERSVQ